RGCGRVSMLAVEPDSKETQGLLQQVRAGDRQAVEALFTRHQTYLHRLIELRLDRAPIARRPRGCRARGPSRGPETAGGLFGTARAALPSVAATNRLRPGTEGATLSPRERPAGPGKRGAAAGAVFFDTCQAVVEQRPDSERAS